MQYPLYVIGKEDTSAYLTRLFLDRVLAGEGGAYFDFSGDITPILSRIPPTRITDTIVVDPTDAHFPVGLNPIHTLDPSTIVDTFKSVWHYDAATPLLDLFLFATVASLSFVPDATLLGMARMLTSDAYLAKVKGHVSDPVLNTFWTDFYETLPEKDRRQMTGSTLNKIYSLIIDPVVRNSIGQKNMSFSVKDTSILIATFPQELGTEKGSFLATLLLSALPPMFTVLDGGFRIGASAVGRALAQSELAFGHQFGAQLAPALWETLIGTAQTLVSFRVGPTDSRRLTPEFYLFPQDDKLHELAPHAFYIRTPQTTDRHPHKLAPLDLPVFDPEKPRRWSREKYGSPRAHVEEKITRFFLDGETGRGAKSKKSKQRRDGCA